MLKMRSGVCKARYSTAFLLILLAFGYFLFTQNKNMPQAEEKNLEELLDLSLEELARVKVETPLKRSGGVYDVPAVVRVISAKQIRERGYLTLEEVLADLPGFQFRNINGFNSYTFLRGIPSQNNKILLLVNGIQINELNSGGFYGGGHYNLLSVEQIEVVYGPASALYGTNAVSGIINIITRQPSNLNKDRIGEIQAGVGQFATKSLAISFGRYNQQRRFGYHLSAMLRSTNKADLKEADGDHNWSDQMENFERDRAFDFTMQFRNLNFGVTYQRKRSSRTTNYKTIDTVYRDRGTLWDIAFFNAFVKYDLTFSSHCQLRTQLYHRNATVHDNTIAYITDQHQVGYFRPNHLSGLETILSLNPTRRVHLTWGMVMEMETLSKGFSKSYSASPTQIPDPPVSPPSLNNTLLSSYLQLQYALSSSLQLTSGFRYDNSNVYDEILTPRLGMVFNNKAMTTKLLYTEAFRAPKPWDYSDGQGNPDLDPEKMKSLELFVALHLSKNVKAELSLYRNRLEGILIKSQSGLDYRWVNGQHLETDGFELSFHYARGKFKGYGNYTYNSSQYENGEAVPEISRHSANVGLFINLSKKLKLDLRCHYLGKRKNPSIIQATGNDEIDAAFIMDMTLSLVNIKGTNLSLIGRNLFDTIYFHSSNRPPDRYRQPQRSIQFCIRYRY